MYSKGWSNKIYQAYSELEADAGTYDNEDWIEKQIKRINNFDDEKELTIFRNRLLISEVKKFNCKNITIVDFGGGLGLSYLPLKNSGYDNVNYKIIEVPKVVSMGNLVYKNDKNISFYSDIENVELFPDIVYIRTSLQYAVDPFSILVKAASLKPKKIILCDTACGNIKTFLTYQLWGDQKIPYWFLNRGEIVETLSSSGYNVNKESVSQSIEHNDSFRDLKSYPDGYRITTLIDFIFDDED